MKIEDVDRIAGRLLDSGFDDLSHKDLNDLIFAANETIKHRTKPKPTVLERVLPVPKGYRILKIENNKVTYVKGEKDFIPLVIKTKREDGDVNTCIVEMPEAFLTRDKYDGKYDDMISEKIEEKIYFEGFGYSIISINKWEPLKENSLSEKEREQISLLVFSMLEKRKVDVKDEWESDFSKEHDFECLLDEIEKYLILVEKYEER